MTATPPGARASRPPLRSRRSRRPMRARTPALRSALGVTALCITLGLAPASAVAQDGDVLVFAAASLKDALDDAIAGFAVDSGVTPTASYAASSALARQIEEGAPAGLFISADLAWMDYLQERDLIRVASRVDLLSNTLVLVAPADSSVTLDIAPGFALLAALDDDGRLAMADPDSVPAGKYGREALTALDIWDDVEPRIARAENVRAALTLVGRGEAPLGIVYATDARADPGVRVVGTFPADSHAPIVYPAALTTEGGDEAAQFLEYLKDDAAAEIFRRHGFEVLE